jgi:hypothetical protein
MDRIENEKEKWRGRGHKADLISLLGMTRAAQKTKKLGAYTERQQGDLVSSLSAEFKNIGHYTQLPPYAFIAWCFIK